MEIAEYVAYILHYKYCKFGEKICYNGRYIDIDIFLGSYFFGAPCR